MLDESINDSISNLVYKLNKDINAIIEVFLIFKMFIDFRDREKKTLMWEISIGCLPHSGQLGIEPTT